MRGKMTAQIIKLRAAPVERWILFANISFYTNMFMAAGKLAVGLYSASIFLSINALYNAGMALARIVAVNGYKAGKRPPTPSHPRGYGRREYHSYFYVGLILAINSMVYIVYSMRLFWVGDSIYYDTIPGIAIATFAFSEIGVSAYGVSATRKYKEPAVSAIKLTNLASGLISLVLTQMALLSFAHDGEVSFYNGLIGMLMGIISAMIGIGMMIRMARVLNGRHSATIKKKLQRLARKYDLNANWELIRIEDYGPRSKRLYLRAQSRDDMQEIKKLAEDHLGIPVIVHL